MLRAALGARYDHARGLDHANPLTGDGADFGRGAEAFWVTEGHKVKVVGRLALEARSCNLKDCCSSS